MAAQSNSFFLKVQDHSVSGEIFDLHFNDNGDMLITTPQPAGDGLMKYYQSQDYISHTDGNRTFLEKLYNLAKRFALKKKVTLINQLQNGAGSLLDIGAGTGDFLSIAREGGWKITGVEPNEAASKLAKNKGIALCASVEDLEDKQFDIITLWHVLEHIPDLEAQIHNLKLLLKPGGHLVIAVPNFRSYDAKYYGEYWAAFDVPRHLWHFSKSAIARLFLKENMYVKQSIPMKLDSFYVSLLSEKYKYGSTNYMKAAYIGFKSNFSGRTSKEYSSHIYVIKNRKSALK